MKTYKFSFTGRQTGAIGIVYRISQEYTAPSLKSACTMLFKDYEHFSRLKLNGESFKIESKHLDCPETLKTYKGLGMNRK